MTRLDVRAKANSKKPGLRLLGTVLEVRVAEPARDGLANAAIRRALAKALGIPQARVALLRGVRASRKSFEVTGLDPETVRARLLEHEA